VDVQKNGKMVRHGKAVGMMDWRNAGHVEKVSMSLKLCTRAHPSAVDIWFNAMIDISSDLDKDDYSSAAKPMQSDRKNRDSGISRQPRGNEAFHQGSHGTQWHRLSAG
jgi:hypothetical protein